MFQDWMLYIWLLKKHMMRKRNQELFYAKEWRVGTSENNVGGEFLEWIIHLQRIQKILIETVLWFQ